MGFGRFVFGRRRCTLKTVGLRVENFSTQIFARRSRFALIVFFRIGRTRNRPPKNFLSGGLESHSASQRSLKKFLTYLLAPGQPKNVDDVDDKHTVSWRGSDLPQLL